MKPYLICLLLSVSLLANSGFPCDGGNSSGVQQAAVPGEPSVVPPKAAIKGPTEVLAGTLLFLSSEDAVGDNKVWLISDELKASSATCGSNIFFAIPRPGKYTFGLIVANREAQIDYVYHTVTVLSPSGPTNPGPVDPPPTDPQPPTSLQEITRLSREGATKLADPTTATALSTALTGILPSLSSSLPEAKRQVATAIETTLLFRSPASRTKDWLNQWRLPVASAIDKSPPRNVDEYRAMVSAIISGLRP